VKHLSGFSNVAAILYHKGKYRKMKVIALFSLLLIGATAAARADAPDQNGEKTLKAAAVMNEVTARQTQATQPELQGEVQQAQATGAAFDLALPPAPAIRAAYPLTLTELPTITAVFENADETAATHIHHGYILAGYLFPVVRTGVAPCRETQVARTCYQMESKRPAMQRAWRQWFTELNLRLTLGWRKYVVGHGDTTFHIALKPSGEITNIAPYSINMPHSDYQSAFYQSALSYVNNLYAQSLKEVPPFPDSRVWQLHILIKLHS
jgi:hypothetical protein